MYGLDYYTIDEIREIAIGAVRSEIRRNGDDPIEYDENRACLVLDDFTHVPSSIAGIFALNCSNTQFKKFKNDWKKWRKQNGC